MGNHVLFLIFEENFSVFAMEYDVGVGSSYMIFIVLRYIPFYTQFVESFFSCQEWILHFVKCFLFIYSDDHVIIIFYSINVMYNTYWFMYLNHPCLPGMNPTRLWHMMLSMCCQIQSDSILLRSFVHVFIRNIGQ